MALNLRTLLWVGFFAAILWSWWVIYSMAVMLGLDWIGRPDDMMPMGGMSEMKEGMAGGMDMAGMQMTTFGILFPMWAIMMVAMMLPTMVPTLRAYEDLMKSADGTRGGWLGVVLGYFITWVGFAALIAIVQIALLASGMVDALGLATSALFAGLLLIVVGLFQFTRVKEICHGVCHSPMTYYLSKWRTGFGGGFRMGLGLGAFCVGCCWGFMALGFVGGVMSLLWMGLATLFMVTEKLPQVGQLVTKPMGGMLVAAGLGVIVWPYLGG